MLSTPLLNDSESIVVLFQKCCIWTKCLSHHENVVLSATVGPLAIELKSSLITSDISKR